MLQLQAWPETMTSDNGFDLGHQPLELVYRRLHLVNITNGCACKQILRCLYYWKSKPSVNKADEYFLEWTMASNILPLSIFQAAFRPGKLHTQLSLQGSRKCGILQLRKATQVCCSQNMFCYFWPLYSPEYPNHRNDHEWAEMILDVLKGTIRLDQLRYRYRYLI